MLPLVLKTAGEDGMEHAEGVGDGALSSCGVVGSFAEVIEGWCSIPLIDFLRACRAFCIKGFPGEVNRLARDAILVSFFFLVLGPSSSSKHRE